MRFQSILVCASAASLLIGAAEPVRLQPASKWVLEYAEENCRLARKFGHGDQQVTLILDQFEPDDYFRILLVGSPVGSRHQISPVSGRLRFGPGEAESEFEAERGTLGPEPALIMLGSHRIAPLTKAEEQAQDAARRHGVRFDPTPIGPAREAAATWFEVRKGLSRPLVLNTGPMSEPLKALRTCSWDTIRHWGLNVEQQKTLSRKVKPRTKPRNWLRSRDYPESMIRAGHQGLVTVRMIVDANGNPTTCRVQRSTHPKEFDDVVCASVMKNARFEPALDAQGKPVPSYYVVTVRFEL